MQFITESHLNVITHPVMKRRERTRDEVLPVIAHLTLLLERTWALGMTRSHTLSLSITDDNDLLIQSFGKEI